MLPCKLDRPLAVFDLEATGISPRADKIVEISIVKIMPDGTKQVSTKRINPQIHIPEETTRIHGISDEDVADCPSFKEVAPELYETLNDSDLCGYNLIRYDIPMLIEEFLRSDIKFDIDKRRVIDVQRIFHRREPRDLTAALAFYCDEMHLNAHGAEADVMATISVLEGQFKRYGDLPTDLDKLNEYCNPRDPSWADRTGRLKWTKKGIALNFGKMKGTLLQDLINNDRSFIKWMMRSDFPRDVKQIIEDGKQGKWPQRPS
ncbi:MAG: 3'-5' exonuclease [Kiritimatiellae bacterium]|nr:3'-5' exonuclease [Kiritimatiellia bacterium]